MGCRNANTLQNTAVPGKERAGVESSFVKKPSPQFTAADLLIIGCKKQSQLSRTGWYFQRHRRDFDKNLFVRLVTQYNSFSKSIALDPLISYKWNPFTVLYFGTTHRFEQVNDVNSLNGMALKEKSRQNFIKFQYLLQM